MKILYLRNLVNSNQDSYLDTLYALFPNADIEVKTPDYTETPFFELVYDLSMEESVDCVIGTDFCGFIAYIVGIGLNAKTLLVNPYIPAIDYLEHILPVNELPDDVKDYWERYNGKNEDCHILLSATSKVPDFSKVFDEVKNIADTQVYCNKVSLDQSEQYKDWLNRNITSI